MFYLKCEEDGKSNSSVGKTLYSPPWEVGGGGQMMTGIPFLRLTLGEPSQKKLIFHDHKNDSAKRACLSPDTVENSVVVKSNVSLQACRPAKGAVDEEIV